jgi:hypothetical protein
MKIAINLSKIDKSKIVERKYRNKEGKEVVEKIYNMELVSLKEKKFVYYIYTI